MKKIILLSLGLFFGLALNAQFTGGGTTSSSNNNSKNVDDSGLRKYFFIGYGVVHGWASDELTQVESLPAFSLTWAYGINENMSWGWGAHVGFVTGNFENGFDDDLVEYVHWSVYGQYYYHFLPRDSKIDLAAVGTLGYAKASILEEGLLNSYERQGLPKAGIKLGVAGLAKLRLGKRFGFYGKLGYDPMAGHVQLGFAWGK